VYRKDRSLHLRKVRSMTTSAGQRIRKASVQGQMKLPLVDGRACRQPHDT
jgi:hypothetical protein